jgi:hypothetical protein
VKRLGILFFLVLINLSIDAQFMNVRSWKKTERDSLEKGLLLLEEKKTQQALPIFENILNNHPTEEFLKYSYAKCALLYPDRQSEAYKRLNEVYEKNRKAPDIQFYMAMAAYVNYNYDEASAHITSYLNNRKVQPEARKNAEVLKKQITYARYFYTHPTRSKVYNLGNSFNSSYDESIPAVTADESLLLYNYSGSNIETISSSNASAFTEQIYVSTKEEGEFKTPHKLDSTLLNNQDNVVSLSNDGTLLFILRKDVNETGDIYSRRLKGSSYGNAHKLKGLVNSPYAETFCSLSPNGKTLYFSSDRPGGYGGKDLYRASLANDSSWINIVNLGDSINTPLDEEAPFIHSDGKTLFFSSKGHVNMGGFDIFKSQMNLRDSSFKKIDNLGSPINTPFDDIYFVVTANGENAYLTSNRKDGRGRSDIYHVEPNIKSFKPSLCLLKGTVYRNDKPCKSRIEVEVMDNKKNFTSTLLSNESDGTYMIVLPTGAEYRLTFLLDNYKTKSASVDLSDMIGFVEKIKNMSFDAILDSIKPLDKTIQKTEDLQITYLPKNGKTNLNPAPATNTLLAVVKNEEHSSVTQTVAIAEVLSTIPKNEEKKNTDSPLTPSIEKKDSSILAQKNTTTTSSIKTTTQLAVKTASIINDKSNELKSGTNATKESQTILSQKTNTLAHINTPSKDTVLTKQSNTLIKKSVQVSTINVTNSVKSTTNTSVSLFNTDGFEPNSATQEKMMMNAYKYGNISYDSLAFRVQISAFKNNERYYFPRLEKFGKIEKMELGDGYKRLMLGGNFSTYGRAFAYAKKIIKAGHPDVFIVVIYKGYRYSVEDLEEVGIFK